MSYRFTNTDKWNDAWFSNLKQIEMLLFIYLCDNCDIAGFVEVNIKRWASDLGSSNDTILGAIEGLSRGLISSKENDCLYIKNFLKHQKNLPLNKNNNAHLGILKRFEYFSQKFDIQNIEEFILAPNEGLTSPIGKGKGNDKVIVEWKKDFSVYLKECSFEFERLANDKIFLQEQAYFHPNVNIYKSIMKCYKDYWGTEEGWKKKKQSGGDSINWKTTIIKALNQSFNKVYFTKQEQLAL